MCELAMRGFAVLVVFFALETFFADAKLISRCERHFALKSLQEHPNARSVNQRVAQRT